MAAFIALVGHTGPIPAGFVAQAAPDPAVFGLPTEDDGDRDDVLIAQNLISCTHHEHDLEALRAASTRIVPAVGAESEGEMAHRAGVALAERLDLEPVVFPSHHGGHRGLLLRRGDHRSDARDRRAERALPTTSATLEARYRRNVDACARSRRVPSDRPLSPSHVRASGAWSVPAAAASSRPDRRGAAVSTTARTDDAHELLVPIVLELSPIRRLLIVDIADDPTYRTLEPQVLDGPEGDELVLLAYRHDGHVELYAPTGREVDPSGYDGLGKGLAGIHHTEFEPARFEVTDHGLQLDLSLAAPNGRRFDLSMHEQLADPRDRFPVLAPVGGAFDTPAFFPFLWLPGMSFVPVRGTEVDVQVDGHARTVPRLPLPIGGRRCLMARYDPDVLVCQLNPEDADVPTRVPAHAGGGSSDSGVDVVEVGGRYGVAAVRVGRDGHTCAAVLDPPLPDVRSLTAPTRLSGAIFLQADHVTELRGRYELTRADDRADLVIAGFGPWRTRLRRPLLALLFRLPIFRRWPTTYRGQAALDLTTPQQRLTTRWSRCPPR